MINQQDLDNILSKLNTRERLDYLVKTRDSFDKALLKLLPISPIGIPEPIYEKYFSKGLQDPEFTFWFLKFEANIYFEMLIEQDSWEDTLKGALALQQIKAELASIQDFETKAGKLLAEGKIDIRPQANRSYANHEEQEYCRIADGYYERHPLADVHSIGNPAVRLYARHILLKEFLEDQLKDFKDSSVRILGGGIESLSSANKALALYYMGWTQNQVNDQYGQISSMANDFRKWAKEENRTDADTDKKVKSLKKRLVTVMAALSDQSQQSAVQTDLNKLNNNNPHL